MIKRIFIKYGNTVYEPFHDSETTLRSILSNPLKSTSSRTHIYIYISRDRVEAHSGYTPFRQKGSFAKFKKRKEKRKGRKDGEKGINERDSESDTRAQTDRLVDIVLQSEFFSRRYWNLASLSRFQSGQSQQRNTLIDNGFRWRWFFASNKRIITNLKFSSFRDLTIFLSLFVNRELFYVLCADLFL